MKVRILASSPYFVRHVRSALSVGTGNCVVHGSIEALQKARGRSRCVVIVHARSCDDVLDETIRELCSRKPSAVGVAADRPQLEEMLRLSRHGVRAYFNSYMAAPHYSQLVRMLGAGQTWFHPELLGRALQLAQRAVSEDATTSDLAILTAREKEIALDVAQGLSNKRIAIGRSISERTVKTHLTRIFKKLHISDRTTLAVRISGAR